MKTTIRPLIDTDLPRMLEIAKLKIKSGGTLPPQDPEKMFLAYQRYTLNDGKHFGFGYFENDELISYIGFGLYENTTRGRFWYVAFLHTSRFHKLFSFNNIEISELMKLAYSTAESKGHYEYYYAIAEKLERVYEMQWKKQQYIKSGRYNLEILARIPANTISDVDMYFRLLGEGSKPDNMVIKKRSLKEEYRLSINS